jgi:hypothetical protein
MSSNATLDRVSDALLAVWLFMRDAERRRRPACATNIESQLFLLLRSILYSFCCLDKEELLEEVAVMKEKQGRFLDKHVALKNFVPGVGTHKKTEIDSFLLLSRGPSPHYKRGI